MSDNTQHSNKVQQILARKDAPAGSQAVERLKQDIQKLPLTPLDSEPYQAYQTNDVAMQSDKKEKQRALMNFRIFLKSGMRYRISYSFLEVSFDQPRQQLMLETSSRSFLLEGRNLEEIDDQFAYNGILWLQQFDEKKHLKTEAGPVITKITMQAGDGEKTEY